MSMVMSMGAFAANIELDHSVPITFATQTYPTTADSRTITVTNNGAGASQQLIVTLVGDNPDSFDLSSTYPIETGITLQPTETFEFTIAPASGINAASHTATIIVSDEVDGGMVNVELDVAITVDRGSAPTINFPTAATITYGAALSTSNLTGGSTTYGEFDWANGATIPTVTNDGYSVTFTPN
ncbi:MAG: hypothetical protein FWE83_11620, partial [Oscillospiraceae bacterium]|nr:hypothetical protein [Oscillospiraceae bacterium]